MNLNIHLDWGKSRAWLHGYTGILLLQWHTELLMELVQTQLNWTQSCCGAAVTAVEPLHFQALPHQPSSPRLANTHLFRYHQLHSPNQFLTCYPKLSSEREKAPANTILFTPGSSAFTKIPSGNSVLLTPHQLSWAGKSTSRHSLFNRA